MNMKESDKGKSHISTKVHMNFVPSNNVRNPVKNKQIQLRHYPAATQCNPPPPITKIQAYMDITFCPLINSLPNSRRYVFSNFSTTWYPEDRGSKLRRNICNYSRIDIVYHITQTTY